jgi:hypothetical protein
MEATRGRSSPTGGHSIHERKLSVMELWELAFIGCWAERRVVWCESVDGHTRHGQQGGGDVRRCGRPARAGTPHGTDQGVYSRHTQELFGTTHRPVVTGLPRCAVRRRTVVAMQRAGVTSRTGAFRRRNNSV